MEVRANYNEIKGPRLLAPLTAADGTEQQVNRPVPPGHGDVPRAPGPVDRVLNSPNLVLAEEFDVYSAAGHIPDSLHELLRANSRAG